MTKIEETENVFFALGTALKAEALKPFAFTGFGQGGSSFQSLAEKTCGGKRQMIPCTVSKLYTKEIDAGSIRITWKRPKMSFGCCKRPPKCMGRHQAGRFATSRGSGSRRRFVGMNPI